jgi:hypothetical protein
MTDDYNSALKISDLKLLMDNYQNVVQLNTILLEQQKKIIELQQQIMTKQEAETKNQERTCDRLDSVVEKLRICIEKLEKTNDVIYAACEDIERNIIKRVDHVDDSFTRFSVDTVKQHSGINRNVYVAWIGTGTVIVALVGLLITVFGKFELLNDVHDLLNKLVTYFIGK